MKTLLALVVTTGVAFADEPDYSQYTVEARPHVKLAIEAYGKSDYATSIREWEAAYALDRNPALLYSLAQAERFGRRCSAAIVHYKQYLTTKISDNQAIATRGAIQLCQESVNKSGTCAVDGSEPTALPWYKNPITGAVIAGSIGVTVGLGFLIAASSSHDRAKHATDLDQFNLALDEATTRQRIGFTSLILGTALGVGAVIYHYKFRGSITATSSSAGVAVAGSF